MGGRSLLIRPVAALFVGAPPRRIQRIAVRNAFFPPRSETSHRFPSRHRATDGGSTSHTHWFGGVYATDGHTAARARVPRLTRSRARLYKSRVLTTRRGGAPDYCPQRGFPYRGYRSADSDDSDNRQSLACVCETLVLPPLWRHSQGIATREGENVSLPK